MLLFSDGTVVWKFGGNFLTSCSLDMSKYPFDTQQCSVVFENWAYSGDDVELDKASDTVDIDDGANSNGLWNIDSTSVSLEYDTSDFGVQYSLVTFSLNLSRKPRYYLFNLIAPGVLLVAMTLAVFWLPADSGEKVGFGTTILLSFAVFLLVIMDSTPRNSDHTPIICK